jgi:hypothetical protein
MLIGATIFAGGGLSDLYLAFQESMQIIAAQLSAGDLDGLRTRREINAPSGLSFCPPASLQKGFHILDMRPFLRLPGEQNSYAI